MKLHQMLSHIKRNNAVMKVRVQDIKKLLEEYGEVADYLDAKALSQFMKKNFPEYTAGVYVRLNRFQRAILQTYQRPVSYAELLHVHTWWNRFSELPKRTYPRLDQHDPFLAAKGYLEQERLVQQIGSIQAGIKNPLTRNHDLLVVVGTATGFEEQLASVQEPHDTMGVNGAGVKIPCDFFFSIHGSYLRTWKDKVIRPDTKTVCEWWIPGIDAAYGIFNKELMQLNMFHYSGNMAAMTGIMMGYPRILMVGCPLSDVATDEKLLLHEGKYLEIDTWKNTLKPRLPVIHEHFLKGMDLFPEIKKRVRSISGGFTETTLGREWNNDEILQSKSMEK